MLIYDINEIKSTPYSKVSGFSHAAIVHSHKFFEFTIILNGRCNSIINNGEKKVLQAGTLLFMRPGDIHMLNPITPDYRHRDFYITIEKMKHICDIFSGTFFNDLFSPGQKLEYHIAMDECNLLDNKASVFDFKNSQKTTLDYIHTALITQLLGIIVNQSLPSGNAIPDWLSSLYLHLSSFHYVNKNVNEIVATTGFSHSYVCQKFKNTYGTTLIDCLNKSKVILSVSLLGKEKIIDIAMALGWENPKNYTLAFKKVFGVTPQKYIALKKAGKEIVANHSDIIFPTPPPTHHLTDIPHSNA